MAEVYVDLRIDIVSPKRSRVISGESSRIIHEAPSVKKTGDKVAISTSRSAPSADAGSPRRDHLIHISNGYGELERQTGLLLDDMAEQCKDIEYRFDPDEEAELMALLGEFFGTAEPVITSKMYVQVIRMIKEATLELAESAIPGQ